MTPLRRELQQGREEYREARYPGDLAGELLPRLRRRNWRIVGLIASSAIAACVVLWITLHAVKTTPNQVAVVPASNPAATEEIGFEAPSVAMTPATLDSIPSMPMAPSAMDLSLPSMDLSLPAMPAIPAWDEQSTKPSKTQEAI